MHPCRPSSIPARANGEACSRGPVPTVLQSPGVPASGRGSETYRTSALPARASTPAGSCCENVIADTGLELFTSTVEGLVAIRVFACPVVGAGAFQIRDVIIPP